MNVRLATDQTQGGKQGRIAAEAFLEALSAHGVDYLFANPGTDFPPIVEAYCRASRSNTRVPTPLVIPHENLAVAMAHGAYAMTGRPQAVMVHVNVGTANTITNVLNLGRDRIPVIVAAGRTPIVEKEKFGSRNRPIHWGQEMFDQGAMLREAVKWDYELRSPEQACDVVARAYEVAMTSPRGPVYLSLPREPLAAPLPESFHPEKPRSIPSRPFPDPRAIATLAGWIASARSPLMITTSSGSEAMAVLGRLSQRYAIPVCTHRQLVVCLPSSHPMHMGYDPKDLLPNADLLIEIESDVPYIPNLHGVPSADCRIATVGEDPAFVRYPMRSFPTDLAITASAVSALEALEAALEKAVVSQQRVEQRRNEIVQRQGERRARLAKASEPAPDHISLPYLSRIIGEVIGEDAVLFNEYSLLQDYCPRERPDTFYALSSAGGLGWGLGAALGAKVAAPEKLVVAVLGDGSYMFSNPMVAHWAADVHKIPVLTVLLNNSLYGAVRSATLSMFKDGVAGENEGRFMADLRPSPAYEVALKAHDGHGERVELPADLPAALRRAIHAVVKERRQALLNVICRY
jgi:acetolactate synthase I/II/III large subunit